MRNKINLSIFLVSLLSAQFIFATEYNELSSLDKIKVDSFIKGKFKGEADYAYFYTICNLSPDQKAAIKEKNPTGKEALAAVAKVNKVNISNKTSSVMMNEWNSGICADIREFSNTLEELSQKKNMQSVGADKYCYIDEKDLNMMVNPNANEGAKMAAFNKYGYLTDGKPNIKVVNLSKDWNSRFCQDARNKKAANDSDTITDKVNPKTSHPDKNHVDVKINDKTAAESKTASTSAAGKNNEKPAGK